MLFVVRPFSKFFGQVFPLVCATVVSALVLSALNLSSSSSAPTRALDDDHITYVDVLPKINRDPQVAPSPKPAPQVVSVAPTEERAPEPAKARPQESASIPAGREPVSRPAALARANLPAAPKSDPASKAEPVASAAPVAPPMPILRADLQDQQSQANATEEHRVFGVPVPAPVSKVGGAAVEVAKVPVKVADAVAVRPVLWVGGKIVDGVSGVAGWVIGR